MAGAHLMPAIELIRAVEQAGGHLEPDGDGLVIEAPKPLPEPIMAELRAHKAAVIDFLTRPIAHVVLLRVPEGIPESWAQGVADVIARTPPGAYAVQEWAILRERAYIFLCDQAVEAHRLGWTALDLWGVHKAAPRQRMDCAGLLALSYAVVKIYEDRAMVESPHGGQLTYRRRSGLPEAEMCLLWELPASALGAALDLLIEHEKRPDRGPSSE